MTMEQLKKLSPLTQKVSIYIPSNIEGKVVDNSKTVEKASKLLLSQFGGVSVIKINGGWMSDNGFTFEDVILVYSFANNLSDENIDKIYNFMVDMKHDMRQEAVSLEINNELYLI